MYRGAIQRDHQPRRVGPDGGDHVVIDEPARHPEALAEDVQHPVAPDEADEVDTPGVDREPVPRGGEPGGQRPLRQGPRQSGQAFQPR